MERIMKKMMKILLLMFFACLPSSSFSQRISDLPQAQVIYGGSFGATILAPSGWEFQPASANQQKRDHILAIYKRKNVGLDQVGIYITVIPKEIRKPESIDKEISYDRKMSERDGLVLVNSIKGQTDDREYAVNTWKGQGFLRHVGLSPTKDGVLLVIGTTKDKKYDALLHEGVNAIVRSAVSMKVFTIEK